MSYQNYRSFNRYSGKKMVKHIALMSPRPRKSGNLLLDSTLHSKAEFHEKSINISDNINISRNITESQTYSKPVPRTLDLYSQRLSINQKRAKKNETETLKIQRFKLPTIHKSNSKHKNSDLQRYPRQQMNSIFSEIENHMKPKNKQQLSSLLQKKHKQYQFIVQTKAGLNGKNIKINQDIDIIDQKLPHGLKLFCICDGHGVNGHLVAAFIKKKLIENLRKDLKGIQADFLQQQIYLVFQKTNMQLLESQINTELSGSTVVAIFIHNDRIYSFNVGDSRAIMVNFEEELWKSTPLSNDHKPDRQSQAKRIKSNGGRIAAQTNERGEQIGPLRVWMKDVRSPGLAMTRSFGDKAGLKAGTTGDPEVLQFVIKAKNKYMLIASDGVWQHFENYEIVKIISPYLMQQKMQEASRELMDRCVQIWNENYISRDDITFILVKMNSISDEILPQK